MPLKINSFTVSHAGTFITGTKINMVMILEVVEAPIKLIRQVEWCDGKLVMDHTYPSDQPLTPIGTYTYEESDYAHVPFFLSTRIMGHIYKIRLEYDNGFVEAETRFFTPQEILIGIGLASTFTIGVIYLYFKRRRK